MSPELFVVVARNKGALKDVEVFSSIEAAEQFCDRLNSRGDCDRIVMTSKYLDLPFAEGETYQD